MPDKTWHFADGTGVVAVAGLLFFVAALVCFGKEEVRRRPRDLGFPTGVMTPGPLNAITDVSGVRVGHVTIMRGDDVRTGVTAVLPHGGNLFQDKVAAAIEVFNGFGKLAGFTQVRELGNIESPVILTNTLSVGAAMEGAVRHALEQSGNEDVRSVNIVVGETNDGSLNDIRGLHVRPSDVQAAIETAREGPVAEGAVGAGTGTRALGFKGGIGTSSRLTEEWSGRRYTVGVLVQSNFGSELVMQGVPVGRILRDGGGHPAPVPGLSPNEDDGEAGRGGSCMIVIATDAPLSERNLERLARRAFIGMGRTTTVMSNGSGDYAVAFSTSRIIPHRPDSPFIKTPDLVANDMMTVLFRAAEEAVEEAIYNSLFMAETMTGRDGNRAEALPIGKVLEILKAFRFRTST
ncbi:MAG: P1 family peptidase [Acidobacteriota bacterium]|nr:P1 family peptidase [Acidobacteriota bacterium]